MGNTKKYHFLYKTTNLKNGKFYIGVHSSFDMNDGYIGSGYKLKYAIKKYGIENFKREVLEIFENKEMMFLREAEVVNEQLLKNPMCMNITIGGNGGWSSEQQRQNAIKSNQKQKLLRETNPDWCENRSKKLSKSLKLAYKNGKKAAYHFCDWTGKSHSEKTKEKMKGHCRQTGSKNSQYGKPRSEETKKKIRESLKKTLEEKKSKIR